MMSSSYEVSGRVSKTAFTGLRHLSLGRCGAPSVSTKVVVWPGKGNPKPLYHLCSSLLKFLHWWAGEAKNPIWDQSNRLAVPSIRYVNQFISATNYGHRTQTRCKAGTTPKPETGRHPPEPRQPRQPTDPYIICVVQFTFVSRNQGSIPRGPRYTIRLPRFSSGYVRPGPQGRVPAYDLGDGHLG